MINYDCFDVFIELYLTLVLLLLNILLKVSFLGEWISIMCKKNLPVVIEEFRQYEVLTQITLR